MLNQHSYLARDLCASLAVIDGHSCLSNAKLYQNTTIMIILYDTNLRNTVNKT